MLNKPVQEPGAVADKPVSEDPRHMLPAVAAHVVDSQVL
jgi:hypothetical protein